MGNLVVEMKKVASVKAMTPQQRLTKLIRGHITRTEKRYSAMDNAPFSHFHAMAVLTDLDTKLSSNRLKMTNKFERHGVLAQLISNELGAIRNVTDNGCFKGAQKLLEQYKTHGSSFVQPVKAANRVLAAA